jgi:hypothetical protein
LYSNQIVNLPIGSFESLPSLKRLRLDSNAIKCDCSLMWFVKMLKSHQHSLVVAATCHAPKEMEGKNLNTIVVDDLHCGEWFFGTHIHIVGVFGNFFGLAQRNRT